jgi:uncharacterized protein
MLENFNNQGSENISALGEKELAKAQLDFVSKAYGWMVAGLLTTGTIAWYMFDSGAYLYLLDSMMFLMIGTLGLVWFMSSRIDKISAQTAMILFIVYAGLLGVTLSTVFAIYSLGSIANVFFITSGMFGAMSVYGFTAKKDLSGMGRFMFMGLVGIIIASVANFFIASSVLDMTISFIGVIVFAGLAAYDTQKIKEMYTLQFEGSEVATKGAIMGALTLYLDFINLFLFLLRFLGDRD